MSSLDSIVDEIIVVDTGSTDRSGELAARHGAKVFQFAWNDDFSAARNFAIERASCPWFLYIDADERLREGDRRTLHATLSAPGAVAATVRFYPRTGYTAYRECRLYRRDPRLRFEGVVHESMFPAIRRLVAVEGGNLLDCDLTIDHVGYDGPQTHKSERYLQLLARATESNPERIYLWWHLGSIHRDLGRIDEATASWRRGLALARARGPRDGDDCLCHIELIKLELASGGDAAELIADGRRLRPDHHLLQWFEAKSLMRRGRFGDASAIFAAFARIDPETFVAENAYDKRVFGAGAADLAGECAFRVGDYAEAAHWYGVAEAATDAPLEYRCKRQLAELRSRRAPPAC
ncbi:MAG: glycosyltransferase [Acetobacteraceae bacterium]|nr:glycosyltransferase [Acetobacteraceae bacterium]